MSKYYIDYKVTIWNRIKFNSEKDFKDAIEEIEAGVIPTDGFSGDCENDTLYDTEEFINPNENDGQSTIECYKDNKMIWDNSYESEINRK